MAFSTSPSSSSFLPFTSKWSYDVFLSFREIDTRDTFIAHLYPALNHKGIRTYKDDKDLERGETISPTLLKAIEESMISIIVLSRNYASSLWCLEELTKILECKETKQQIILPVFYHIDPSKVRKLEGSFEEALANHQERFKEDPKVQRWKKALQEVASLAGEHLEDGNEYEFMHKIIQWVDSEIVKSTYQLHIAEYPIGLESHLKDLNTDLGIGRNDITLVIGIYGISGVGKTTIAKAVFYSIGNQFEARCFLANVREISNRENGLVELQKQLLDDLLGNFGSFNIGNVRATNVIKHRLRSKRVLLILDDVNELCQLKELAGNKYWFGPGSRIVIITRDRHLLTYHPVDSTYEVQGLNDNQAIQLFSWHAFKRDKPVESYEQLTKCIIGYANGLPLVLTVLGSALRGKSIQEWKNVLEKYERNPHKDIYEILKISYDGLNDNEKYIFLHIASVFKGKSLEYVKNCLFSSITRLEEKCLITISHIYSGSYVEMHDLLQEMGKEQFLQEMGKGIVRQESPKEAGECSRLWFHEDVRHVLEENTGTNKIERMLLDFPGGHNKICLHPEAFGKMRNLRLFISQNAQFSTGPNYQSNWDHYPSSSLPSTFRGDKLRILPKRFKLRSLCTFDFRDCSSLEDFPEIECEMKFLQQLVLLQTSIKELPPSMEFLMHNSLVKEPPSMEFLMHNSLVKELGGPKFESLTYMDLRDCEFLTKIPDFSSSPNLEELDLACCKNLVEVHHSVGLLYKLRSFSVMGCCKLRILPKRFKLRSLHTFDFRDCSSLEDFPEIECEMEFLQELDLLHTSIKELPSSMENLKGLEKIRMRDCSIIELPSSIVNLPWLKKLYVEGCIDQLGSVRIVKVDSYSKPINIGKVVEEDGIQSTSSIVSTGE